MRQNMTKWTAVLVAVIVSVLFAACGGEDGGRTDPNGNQPYTGNNGNSGNSSATGSNESALIGTWVSTATDNDYDKFTYVFNANKTGREITQYKSETNSNSFTWSTSNGQLTIKGTSGEGLGAIIIFNYSISSNKLTLQLIRDYYPDEGWYDYNKPKSYIYYKQ